jgi:polyhydroxyalkanoate synthesis repressor PhaR
MIRLIKRYESRKLYDTEESRYVSLEDIASWIREGQDVRVVDNATAADVTSQTLTQIIVEEGRKGGEPLPSELLHDLVRLGERTVTSGIEQVQSRVGRLVHGTIDRLSPVRQAREEMNVLRNRLEQLEASLSELETPPAPPKADPTKTQGAKKGAAKSGSGSSSGPSSGPSAGAPRKKTQTGG